MRQAKTIEKGKQAPVKEGHKRQKAPAAYFAGIAGVLFLVATAFLSPSLLFGMQDKREFQSAETAEQESLEVVLLNAKYEAEVGKRLQAFSQGLVEGKQYRVTEAENVYGDDDSYKAKIVETILYEDWVEFFYNTGILRSWTYFDSFYELMRMDEGFVFKKYVVYDENYLDSVPLILWYLQIPSRDGSVLELVADAGDTEASTIYYLRMNTGSVNYRTYRRDINLQAFVDEMEWYYYYHYYYGSDIGNIIIEIEKNGESSEVLWEQAKQVVDQYSPYMTMSEDRVETETEMPYGEAALHLKGDIWDQKDSVLISFGIQEIADLIPELQ